jgi:hypothetical protein
MINKDQEKQFIKKPSIAIQIIAGILIIGMAFGVVMALWTAFGERK